MTPTHRAALAYAQRLGWPVFPCRPKGKEPLTTHGVHDASTDPGTITTWWKRWPEANIGLACALDRVAIDVDPRNGGDESWGAVVRQHGDLPRTPRAVTGSGGQHIFVAFPAGVSLKKCLLEGVDLQGPGRYVIAAPSIHPCGGKYSWELLYHPLEAPITIAPQWLVEGATDRAPRRVGSATGSAAASFLARCFDTAGWLGIDLPGGKCAVRCPWVHEHSDGRGDGRDASTVILPPTHDRPLGQFHCAHGHCATRGNVEALRALPDAAIALQASTDPEGFRLALSLIRSRAA